MSKNEYVPATVRQKAQLLDMFEKGQGSRAIAIETGLHPLQVRAHLAHVTMGTYSAGIADAAGAMETTMGLERDLQNALRANIDQIETGLTVVGEQVIVQSGRIDILAEDSDGKAVVIELKAGTADRDAVSQILSYIGDIDNNTRPVRGIIIAGDFAYSAISAAKAAKRVQLLKYSIKFSFKAVKV